MFAKAVRRLTHSDSAWKSSATPLLLRDLPIPSGGLCLPQPPKEQQRYFGNMCDSGAGRLRSVTVDHKCHKRKPINLWAFEMQHVAAFFAFWGWSIHFGNKAKWCRLALVAKWPQNYSNRMNIPREFIWAFLSRCGKHRHGWLCVHIYVCINRATKTWAEIHLVQMMKSLLSCLSLAAARFNTPGISDTKIRIQFDHGLGFMYQASHDSNNCITVYTYI